MSVSNTTVKQLYLANGVTTTFAIPFAFISFDSANEVEVYLVDVLTGALTARTRGIHYDLDVVDPALVDPGNVIFKPSFIPAATHKVLVIRNNVRTQPTSYIDDGPFPAKTHEKALDRLLLMIQELSDKLKQKVELNILDDGTFNVQVPKMAADKVLGTDATGTGFKLYDVADFQGAPGAPGAGIPAGGAIGDFLEKNSLVDGDAVWKSATFAGISRFGAWSSTGLLDTITKILNITYTPPTISLVASGSGTIREKGASVASTTLTATVTKLSNNIAEVRFYLSPSTLLDTKTGTIPTGGVENTTYSTPFSNNVSFYARVDDVSGGGGPTTVTSNTVTFTFVYPYYYGAGAAGLGAGVAALTKDIIVSTATVVKTITASAGQKLYFAYPAAYGALTSILDASNFETFPDWTRTTVSITGLDATSQSYYVYEFNNPVVAGSYLYTFKR